MFIDPTSAAIIGAIIGLCGALFGALISAVYSHKSNMARLKSEREFLLMNLAVKAALVDYKSGDKKFFGAHSLSSTLYFHWKWLLALENNEGNSQKLIEITKEAVALSKTTNSTL